MSDLFQGKALVKGCHERTRAQGRVSSQEKVHTNRNLARATAKSRAGHRQSKQMCQSGQERIQEFIGLQRWRLQEMSGIEVQRFQHACRKGYRTYDNRTEEIQLSRRTTYRAPECRAARNSIQSEHGKEGLCNYGSCLHAVDG